MIATFLALSMGIVGAAETSDASKPIPTGKAADAASSADTDGRSDQDIPEPSAALIGSIGLLLLLSRRRLGQGRS